MQANCRKIQFWRTSATTFVCAALLAGCSIKNDVPDFKYPSRTNFTNQSWPELAVTDELMAVGKNTDKSIGKAQQEIDRVTARAARLRARARGLQNSP